MLRAGQVKAGPRCTLIPEVEPEGRDQTRAAVCGPHGLQHPPTRAGPSERWRRVRRERAGGGDTHGLASAGWHRVWEPGKGHTTSRGRSAEAAELKVPDEKGFFPGFREAEASQAGEW